MEFETALNLVNDAMSARFGRLLNDAELALFKGAWHNHTYEVTADESGYSSSYLTRAVGPKFWKNLSEALGERVSKTSFRAALERRSRQVETGVALQRSAVATLESEAIASDSLAIDWGEAPDVSAFYGRQAELAALSQWVETDGCRLVSILGMGGIGKTSLAAKFIEGVAGRPHCRFQRIIWRSLRNAPTADEWLEDVVPFVSGQQDMQPTPRRLLHWLRQSRCLLILDNVETVLQEGSRAGYFRAGYEDYGEVLQLIAETRHHSCLVLTTREKPAAIGALEGAAFQVRSLQLSGSSEAALSLLDAKGLVGTDAEKQQLGDRYGNSPLALKIVATSIQSLFDGEIALFLAEDTLVFNGLQRLLQQQFERLSALEQIVMYWLAINRDWTSIAELVDDIQPTVTRQQILEALESLRWRSLIETQSGLYTQQPVVMEYVSDRFVEHLCAELLTMGGREAQAALASGFIPSESSISNRADLATAPNGAQPHLFYSYALLKTTVKDYVRESQVRLIVEPIAKRLQTVLPTPQAIAQHFQTVFATLRHDLVGQFSRVGQDADSAKLPYPTYGPGNFLNLCCHLNVDLTGLDFSGLTIWQADLRSAQLQQVNFAHTHIAKTLFSQHFSAISAVAFSPDGRLLALGDAQGQLHLWRLSDLQPCLTLSSHVGWVQALCFNADGTLLISAGDDHVIHVWRIRQITTITVPGSVPGSHTDLTHLPQFSGVLAKRLEGHSNRVWSMALSPRLVSAAPDPNRHGGDRPSPPTRSRGRSHSQWLATGSGDRTVKLWDLQTGHLLATAAGHTSQVTSVRFSPDGTLLASSSLDQTVKLWSICSTNDGVELVLKQTLEGHQGGVWSVRFHPEVPLLVSSSGDRTLKLWHLPTGKVMATLKGHTAQISTLELCPDGRHLLSGSNDTTIKLWDISDWVEQALDADLSQTSQPLCQPNRETSAVLATLKGHTRQVWTMALSSEGSRLASGSNDQTMRLWDIASRQLLHTIRGHTNQILAVAVSSNHTAVLNNRGTHTHSTHLLAGSSDQTLRLWSLKTGTLSLTLKGHKNWVLSVAAHPTSCLVASGSADCDIRLWNLHTGKLAQIFSGHGSWVWSVAFSPDGNILASGSFDQTIRLWNVPAGLLLRTLEVENALVWTVTFSPDGQLLASGDSSHQIQVWDVATGRLIQTLAGHTGPVWSVAFSPDGRFLASGSSDCTVKLWQLSPLPQASPLCHTFCGHQSWVRTVAFSPDGQLLASGSYDKTIRLWDIHHKRQRSTLHGHDDWVMAIAFCSDLPSEDDPTLVSGSTDATLKLWNVKTATCRQTLRVQRPYEGMIIEEVQGLTDGQIAVLRELGAVGSAEGAFAESATADEQNQSVSANDDKSTVDQAMMDESALNQSMSDQSMLDRSHFNLPTTPANGSDLKPTRSAAAPASSVLYIQVLNGFNLTYNGQPVCGFTSERSRLLLAYLVLQRHTPQSRQQIAFALYPDCSEPQARTALRKDVFNLRQTLPGVEQFLQIDAKTLAWRDTAACRLDVAEFEAALQRVDSTSPDDDRVVCLERAIALYTGELLPSFYQDWVIQERECLHQRYLDALEQMIQLLEGQHDYRLAIRYAQRLLQESPLRESTYQTLMRLHTQMGDRATAIQIYHQCMTLLHNELGIVPSPETQQLYKVLLD